MIKSNYEKKHYVSRLKKHYVSRLTSLPNVSHFAVLVENTRTYPDPYDNCETTTTTTEVIEYIAFDDEESLNAWILDEAKTMYTKKVYKVIRVNPVQVELRTTVTIKE